MEVIGASNSSGTGQKPMSHGPGAPHATSLPRVLVVDDDRMLRQLIALQLRSRYDVLQAEDGDEALRILGRTNQFENWAGRIRLVLLDIMMPGIDGLTLCHRIKQDFDVAVVMVTARAESVDVQAAMRAGANDYLVKPFTSKTLDDKVARHISTPQPVQMACEQPVVLVVDGNEAARKTIAIVLGKDYTVVEAKDGEQAVRYLERSALLAHSQGTIQAILLDRTLPDIDGITFCRRIRSEFGLPVLMMTSCSEQEDIDAAIAAGANDYLAKPFNYATLREKVERFLRASGS